MEVANQLQARADSLLKQMSGRSRYELPLSVMLRETYPATTDHVFMWASAGGYPLPQDVLKDPIRNIGSEERRDRIRALERIFADLHWSRINTVFASGQGDVSMALIKDDVGNWNLKSFSQDPSDLVDAYTNFGLTLAKAATTVLSSGTGALANAASSAAGAVDSAKKLSDVAETLGPTTRKSSTAVDDSFVSGLRANTIQELEDLAAGLKGNEAAKAGNCQEQEKLGPGTTCRRILDILQRHRRLLDRMQEAALLPAES